MVCQGMADEAAWLADLAGVRFSYSSNTDHLPFQGSKSLLTQMLLALVSNGIRAAGKEGEVEMKFHAENGRCVISVRDRRGRDPRGPDGPSLLRGGPGGTPPPRGGRRPGAVQRPADRPLSTAVSWWPRAARTAAPCLVVSLPIVVPTSVPARNNPGYDNLGGLFPGAH